MPEATFTIDQAAEPFGWDAIGRATFSQGCASVNITETDVTSEALATFGRVVCWMASEPIPPASVELELYGVAYRVSRVAN